MRILNGIWILNLILWFSYGKKSLIRPLEYCSGIPIVVSSWFFHALNRGPFEYQTSKSMVFKYGSAIQMSSVLILNVYFAYLILTNSIFFIEQVTAGRSSRMNCPGMRCCSRWSENRTDTSQWVSHLEITGAKLPLFVNTHFKIQVNHSRYLYQWNTGKCNNIHRQSPVKSPDKNIIVLNLQCTLLVIAS